MEQMTMVRNSSGIPIIKACMSCAHKSCTRLWTARYCEQHQIDVGRDDVCEQWEMSETMKAAGRSEGKIKRREYLIYLASVRADEEIARQLRVNYPYKSIEAIRSEFEKEHGSIYFNL